ncbi:hypothetical protein BH20ACT6_BH20ACT6_07500 [soil metagenome]
MDALEIARWQFGFVTVYHYLFVHLTIGLAPLVAGLQTAWVRTDDERWLRLTKFFGTLFLINFAMGVVTGIVQELQFGMNWSDYSRFVGGHLRRPVGDRGPARVLPRVDVPRAVDLRLSRRLSRRLHLACIWLVAIGTWLSAVVSICVTGYLRRPSPGSIGTCDTDSVGLRVVARGAG